MPENYLGQSLYWENLSRYRALFPDNQIHLCFMEDLKQTRTPSLPEFAISWTWRRLCPTAPM